MANDLRNILKNELSLQKGHNPIDNGLVNNLWENLKLEKINNWTNSANILINTMKNIFCGVEFSKYKIIQDNPFNYYIMTHDFVENIYKNKQILKDKIYLKLNGELPKINIKEHLNNIYTLSGGLAWIIGCGGEYTKGIEQKESWKIATEFVENEFEKRFEEFEYYEIIIENARWFYDVAWDYSFILADLRKNEILFIDITDTD
jgi:hypothetical protein